MAMARRSMVLFVVMGLLVAMVACSAATAPPATPTKAPAAAPTQASSPPKPAEPTKPAAASSTAPAKSLDPILIGYVNAASGFMAPMAQPQKDTVEMLEEKVNKEGGFNGRPLKVVYFDDESDATKAVLAMKKFIDQDKVLAIMGTSSSGISMAVAPVAEAARVPFMTTNSMRAPVDGNKWVFKVPTSERINIEAQYKFMKEKGAKKLALLTVASGLGKEVVKYYDETIAKSGMTIVAREEYGPNDTDMKSQLTRIRAAGSEALVVYGAEAAGAIAVGQAKEMGLNIPIIGPNALAVPGIMAVKQLRDGLEGVFLTGYRTAVWEQLPDSDPQKKINAQLADLVKAKYNRPLSDWEAIAYDSATVLFNAIKAANPDPAKLEEARSKIRDAMENGTKNFVGAMVLIDSYTPTEHEGSPNPNIGILQTIKDGKIVMVK